MKIGAFNGSFLMYIFLLATQVPPLPSLKNKYINEI